MDKVHSEKVTYPQLYKYLIFFLSQIFVTIFANTR